MSSTGKLVVSFEAEPPPVCYTPELRALEERVRALLAPFAETGIPQSELTTHGNTFILTSHFGTTSFDTLIDSLVGASTGAWLLLYGGLDGEGSVMIEAQDGHVLTRRERVPVDTLNDYSDEDTDSGVPDSSSGPASEHDDLPF